MKTLIIEVLFDLVGPLEQTPVDFVEYHNEAIGMLASHLDMDILSISHIYVDQKESPNDPSCICTAVCFLNGQTADSIVEAVHRKAIPLSGGKTLEAHQFPHKVVILVRK